MKIKKTKVKLLEQRIKKHQKKPFPYVTKVDFVFSLIFFLIGFLFLLLPGFLIFLFNGNAKNIGLFLCFLSIFFLLPSLLAFIRSLLILIYVRKNPKKWKNNPWCVTSYTILFSKNFRNKFWLKFVTFLSFIVCIFYLVLVIRYLFWN